VAQLSTVPVGHCDNENISDLYEKTGKTLIADSNLDDINQLLVFTAGLFNRVILARIRKTHVKCGKTNTYFVDSFMRERARLFNSTKVRGKIPILPSSFPSAQFSSTRRITLIMSPSLKTRQPSSSCLSVWKS
jgi:hypothetical protein